MAAAAHDLTFAKKLDIPQSVAREFFRADQRKKRRAALESAFKKAYK